MPNTELSGLSIPELRVRAQGRAPEAGRDPYVGITIRFFSIYITKVILRTRITPLQVTVASVIFFLAGISLFAWDEMSLALWGIALIYVSTLLDGCNGELARLQNYRPEIGSRYVEPISHDIQYGLMFIPLAIGAYDATGSVLVIYAAFIATVSKLLNRFFIMRYDHTLAANQKNVDTEGEAIIRYNPNVSFLHKAYRFVNRNFFSSVGLIVPLLLFTLLNRVDLFIWLFATVYVVFALMHFYKQFRHISRIDVPLA